jgi:CspA family cold shock protein
MAAARLLRGRPRDVRSQASELRERKIGITPFDCPCDKWFDPNKGYGFIRPDQGEDVFVHISAVQASGLQTLQEGQAVEFDIQQGRKGTAGRQPATTAGTRVGMTRAGTCHPG